MYSHITTNAWNVNKKFTVKSLDCRCYMDSSRPKTNDKDKFQFTISEYKCNTPF